MSDDGDVAGGADRLGMVGDGGDPDFGANEAWDAEIERRGSEAEARTADTITLAEYRAHVQRRRIARASR